MRVLLGDKLRWRLAACYSMVYSASWEVARASWSPTHVSTRTLPLTFTAFFLDASTPMWKLSDSTDGSDDSARNQHNYRLVATFTATQAPPPSLSMAILLITEPKRGPIIHWASMTLFFPHPRGTKLCWNYYY
jgi:hypothetical protein